ncbi:hypothetical protein EDC56_3684 [Sinobacterium caligoides]|uniref:Uncharacterized protein n=1 Tax=Sinobacterium caligoides TaxID=933926 RepID=A0A3N2DE06_9GAMM|nr:hypothetical protein EDC56_3684 [Sinobacterium caligoides]
MELAMIVTLIVALIVLVYINILATICLTLDPDLPSIQRRGQIIVTWLLPYFGASLVLYLVSHHSPEVISRLYIPWPFRKLIEDEPIRKSKFSRNTEEALGVHSTSHHSGGDSGGSSSD